MVRVRRPARCVRSPAQRATGRGRAARDELRQIADFSAADEIEKLGNLKAKGVIPDQEYATLRARLTSWEAQAYGSSCGY